MDPAEATATSSEIICAVALGRPVLPVLCTPTTSGHAAQAASPVAVEALLEGLLRPSRQQSTSRGLIGSSATRRSSNSTGASAQGRGSRHHSHRQSALVLGQVIDLRPMREATVGDGSLGAADSLQQRRRRKQLQKQAPELTPTRLRQLEFALKEAGTLNAAAASATATVPAPASISGISREGGSTMGEPAVVTLWWNDGAQLQALQATTDIRRHAATARLAKDGGSQQRTELFAAVSSHKRKVRFSPLGS